MTLWLSELSFCQLLLDVLLSSSTYLLLMFLARIMAPAKGSLRPHITAVVDNSNKLSYFVSTFFFDGRMPSLPILYPLYSRLILAKKLIPALDNPFSAWLFLSIDCCFLFLIYSQFASCLTFIIISLPNTNCPGVFLKVVGNVECTAKAVALRIPFQPSRDLPHQLNYFLVQNTIILCR